MLLSGFLPGLPTYRRAIGAMFGLPSNACTPLRRASPYRPLRVRKDARRRGVVAKKGKPKIVPIARRYVGWPGVGLGSGGPRWGWEILSRLVLHTWYLRTLSLSNISRRRVADFSSPNASCHVVSSPLRPSLSASEIPQEKQGFQPST